MQQNIIAGVDTLLMDGSHREDSVSTADIQAFSSKDAPERGDVIASEIMASIAQNDVYNIYGKEAEVSWVKDIPTIQNTEIPGRCRLQGSLGDKNVVSDMKKHLSGFAGLTY